MRVRTLGVLCAAALMTLSACGESGGDAQTGETAAGGDLGLINEGTLTVCSDIPYPPFEFEQGGEYTGFDIDLMREIATGLDLELEVRDSGFDALQSGLALNSGQCDIAASAMTITEEREQNLDFTEPYYDSLQSLLVPVGSDIRSIEDLAGTKVGVQQGTTGKTFTEENAPEGTQIIAFPSDAEMFNAIKAGQVDALLQDLPVNLEHTEGGEFQVVEEFQTDEHYGFAVKEEGSEQLLEAVNKELQELRDSGKYEEIYNNYFSTE